MKRIRRMGIVLGAAVCFLTGCANYVKDGTKLLEDGQYQEALEAFSQAAEKAEDKGGDVTEAYRGMGLAYYAQKDYGNAKENLQKSLDLGGKETPVIYNLIGVSSVQLGDYDSALTAFQKGTALPAIEDETDYSEVIREMKYNLIVCYEKKQDWENARNAANDYVENYPDDEEVQHEAQFLRTR